MPFEAVFIAHLYVHVVAGEAQVFFTAPSIKIFIPEMPEASVAVAVTFTFPLRGRVLLVGAVMVTTGGVVSVGLFTVTLIGDDVVQLFTASHAFAVNVCAPFVVVVVFQVTAKSGVPVVSEVISVPLL